MVWEGLPRAMGRTQRCVPGTGNGPALVGLPAFPGWPILRAIEEPVPGAETRGGFGAPARWNPKRKASHGLAGR